MPQLWWGLAALFGLLFAIANFPRPSKETIPWLFLSLFCIAIANVKTGVFPKLFDFSIQYGWHDPLMRRHLIVASLFCFVVTPITIGMTGLLPSAFTVIVFHPLDFASAMAERNQISGDGLWPYVILSALAAPWAFPFAYGLVVHTAVANAPVAIRSLIYFSTVSIWWVGQSVFFSFILFKKNIFL